MRNQRTQGDSVIARPFATGTGDKTCPMVEAMLPFQCLTWRWLLPGMRLINNKIKNERSNITIAIAVALEYSNWSSSPMIKRGTISVFLGILLEMKMTE